MYWKTCWVFHLQTLPVHTAHICILYKYVEHVTAGHCCTFGISNTVFPNPGINSRNILSSVWISTMGQGLESGTLHYKHRTWTWNSQPLNVSIHICFDSFDEVNKSSFDPRAKPFQICSNSRHPDSSGSSPQNGIRGHGLWHFCIRMRSFYSVTRQN